MDREPTAYENKQAVFKMGPRFQAQLLKNDLDEMKQNIAKSQVKVPARFLWCLNYFDNWLKANYNVI